MGFILHSLCSNGSWPKRELYSFCDEGRNKLCLLKTFAKAEDADTLEHNSPTREYSWELTTNAINSLQAVKQWDWELVFIGQQQHFVEICGDLQVIDNLNVGVFHKKKTTASLSKKGWDKIQPSYTAWISSHIKSSYLKRKSEEIWKEQ